MDPTFLIILALAFGAMWLMSRRTRKQQKEAANFRANLAPGQDVMTGSGLFGTIVAVEDEIVTLETSPGVTSRWLRPAIAKLVEPPVGEDDQYEEDGEDDGYDDEVDERVGDENGADQRDVDQRRAAGSSGLLEDNSPRFDVPDDASSLTDRRRGKDTGEGNPPRA